MFLEKKTIGLKTFCVFQVRDKIEFKIVIGITKIIFYKLEPQLPNITYYQSNQWREAFFTKL